MLPGFRFLLVAILLSMSILIFGLGAAALLRAAHEEFAGKPSWHAAPGATFAQQREVTKPALTMLRIDPPGIGKPFNEAWAAATDQAVTAPTPVEPEKSAALTPADQSPREPAEQGIQSSESPAPEKTETPASAVPALDGPAPVLAEAPASVGEATIAATEPALPPANDVAPAADAAPAASEQSGATVLPDAEAAATIAALGNPSATVETTPAKAVAAKPDKSAIRKHLWTRRAAQRRMLAAARARLAQQQALQQQQEQLLLLANPFAPQPARPAQPARPVQPARPAHPAQLNRSNRPSADRSDQAGPVATGGPSGRPHSAHEPS